MITWNGSHLEKYDRHFEFHVANRIFRIRSLHVNFGACTTIWMIVSPICNNYQKKNFRRKKMCIWLHNVHTIEYIAIHKYVFQNYKTVNKVNFHRYLYLPHNWTLITKNVSLFCKSWSLTKCSNATLNVWMDIVS